MKLWVKFKIKIPIIILLVILTLAFVNRTYYIYKTQFSFPPGSFIQEEKPIKYIFENAKNKNFGITVLSNFPQQNYDYLIWWYGERYKYQPFRTQKGTYYAIIEPKLIYSSTLLSGKLINSYKFDNKFIVEKRQID
jgi:hypothetical protein